MPSKYLDSGDRVVRYVSWARVRKDEDLNVVGILGAAFSLRAEESYLSVTWCEYFAGTSPESLRCAAEAIRASNLEIRPKGRFAVVEAGSVSQYMLDAGKKLRIIHEPTPDNAAHVAIRGWSSADEELMARLAEDVWSEHWSREQIDALPVSECNVSARGAALAD